MPAPAGPRTRALCGFFSLTGWFLLGEISAFPSGSQLLALLPVAVLERAVAHQLGVDAAVEGEVDVLEENAPEVGRGGADDGARVHRDDGRRGRRRVALHYGGEPAVQGGGDGDGVGGIDRERLARDVGARFGVVGVEVAEEAHLEPAGAGERERHGEEELLAGVDAAHEPLPAGAARDDGERADLALEEARLVEHAGNLAPEVKRGVLLLDLRRTLVPEEELESARIDARERELVGERVLDAGEVPAGRVVAGTVQEARERQRGVVGGGGHLLVAADPLHRQHVGIGLLDAGEAVLVVDVHEQTAVRRGLDRVQHPLARRLSAHLHEPVLHALHAPRGEKVENGVAVLVERDVVHVEDHAHAVGVRVVDDGLHVGVRLQRVARALGTVPAGVELDVLEVVALREVHAGASVLLVEAADAQHLARLDPGGVGDPGRRVQRVQERGLGVREGHAVLRHVDVAPRRGERGGEGRRAFEDGLQMSGALARGEAEAGVVGHARVAEGGRPAVALHHERTLRRTAAVGLEGGNRGERPGHVLALRVAHGPAAEVLPEVERPFLARDGAGAGAVVADAPRHAAGQVGGLEAGVRAEVGRRHAAHGGAVGGRHREGGSEDEWESHLF